MPPRTKSADDPSTNGKPSISERDYHDYMKVVSNHSAATFYICRFDHICYLEGNGNAAAVLSYIINLLKMKDLNPKDRKLQKI